jgi:hypothetical protein
MSTFEVGDSVTTGVSVSGLFVFISSSIILFYNSFKDNKCK